MFSKSDSLKLFTVVTVTSVIVFFLLSYDTLQKIPIQTNGKNITADVIRGKHIWESNNCMGCHTLFGEGAYYAPDLTKVYTKRSENFIKIFLHDPNAMYPGKRKMVSYKFSDKEIDDLISFFKWCGEVDLNGFPAEPYLKKYTSSAQSSNIKQPEMFEKLCLTCHVYQNRGITVDPAPSLDNIGKLRGKDYLIKWLKDPKTIKSNSLMPKFPLADSTISEIVDFLVSNN